jgi:hypothetical protein
MSNSEGPALGLFHGAVWHLVVGALAFVAGVFIEHPRSPSASAHESVEAHCQVDCPTKDLLTEAVLGATEGLTQPQLLARLKRANVRLAYPVADPELLEDLSWFRVSHR